uniref:D-isomer specific 2-hydroxyacid dehydrogenase NAD-binding domain-containing protein n=1 Tax=Rhizochromulina marina TaxID=1034831 RepID=A0A7S2WCK5_9STRA
MSSSKPLVAVVSGPGPALDLMPKDLPVEIMMVDGEDLGAQAAKLSQAQGLLWIPTAGAPSSAPSDVLNRLWPMLSKVSWVHSFAAGVDGLKPFIDKSLKPAAEEGRVSLTNGRGAFSSSLAEYSLAAMLHFNKQLKRCEANRAGRVWDNFVMDVMEDKTVGLVGYGSIGQSCGRAAKGAFGCRVLALRRNAGDSSEGPADEIFGFDDRLEFFKQCDYVICSLPSTPLTQQFVGEAELGAMKSSAVLISIGRGATIDEVALEAALRGKKIHGAALDVFATEPLPVESGLWDCENLLLTAHNADYTADYFELGWKVWMENLDKFLQGKPLATPVDLNAGY